MTVRSAKMADQTETLFGIWTQMGSTNNVFVGAQMPSLEGALLGYSQLVCDIPALAAWYSDSIVDRISEVALHRTRLVLGWVTVLDWQTTSVFNQPSSQLSLASFWGH